LWIICALSRLRGANYASGSVTWLTRYANCQRANALASSCCRSLPAEGGMNTKPTMLDLKESGDIENHSHVVLLPLLPVGDDGGPKPEEQLTIIGKNRNGRIGSLPVYFDEKRLQFCDRTLGDAPRGK
jgi:replicative DNA helicase